MFHVKHLFILLALACSYTLKAQTKVRYDANTGVLIPAKPAKPADKKVAYDYIDKDSVRHEVYQNSKGKSYIIRKSKKTGKEYKQYLDIQP